MLDCQMRPTTINVPTCQYLRCTDHIHFRTPSKWRGSHRGLKWMSNGPPSGLAPPSTPTEHSMVSDTKKTDEYVPLAPKRILTHAKIGDR